MSTRFTADELLPYIGRDKKRAGDRLTFVLPVRPGVSELRPLDAGEVRELVTRGLGS